MPHYLDRVTMKADWNGSIKSLIFFLSRPTRILEVIIKMPLIRLMGLKSPIRRASAILGINAMYALLKQRGQDVLHKKPGRYRWNLGRTSAKNAGKYHIKSIWARCIISPQRKHHYTDFFFCKQLFQTFEISLDSIAPNLVIYQGRGLPFP